jgi:hypothetical protein
MFAKGDCVKTFRTVKTVLSSVAVVLLTVCAAQADVTVPFRVTGEGSFPTGLPVVPGLSGEYSGTGQGSQIGRYAGQGQFELLTFNAVGTSTFEASFVFVTPNGDLLATNTASPGTFTVLTAPGGNVIVSFVFVLIPDPALSTGRFAKVTGGGLLIVATSEPFSPTVSAQGFTAPFMYTWVGDGSLVFAQGQ